MTTSTVYLVDTNSYVRIARSTKNILGDFAGLHLRLIAEIATECNRSSRLKSITPWILQPPHPDHRNAWTLRTTKDEQKLVNKNCIDLRDAVEDALEDFAARKRGRGDHRPVLSGPDKALFFTAYTLWFGVVTDEAPLTAVCKEFDIPHFTTLELLKHLVEHEVLTKAQIDAMVKYWQYEKDEPKDWKRHYRKHFGDPLPIFVA